MFKRHAAVAFVLTSLYGSLASAEPLPEHLTIATEGAYAPWNFTKPDGSLDGYDVELAKTLCSRIHVKCDIVSQEWKGIIPGLTLGKYDAIIAAMGVTEERKKVVAFSVPYAVSPNGFLVSKDGAVSTLPGTGQHFDLTESPSESKAAIEQVSTALKGKVIGVQTGATAAYFVKDNFKGYDVREYPTLDQVCLELASGRIDVAVASATAFKAAIDGDKDGKLALAGPTFKGGVLGKGTTNIAMRPSDTALREALDKAIADINKDGTNKALTEKWFGFDISPK
jgi:octopine/nopaline transport system substrate-binding protein